MNHRLVATQYARRHAAALRLPPIDGYRDPNDKQLEESRPTLSPLDVCQHVAEGRPVSRDDLRSAWLEHPEARPMLEAAAAVLQDGWY